MTLIRKAAFATIVPGQLVQAHEDDNEGEGHDDDGVEVDDGNGRDDGNDDDNGQLYQ